MVVVAASFVTATNAADRISKSAAAIIAIALEACWASTLQIGSVVRGLSSNSIKNYGDSLIRRQTGSTCSLSIDTADPSSYPDP